ncbi:hypothetical protein ACI2L1_06245 [Streptomyces sp. NPDC019531]|uniref:hypothetical protein n=1 Tax=Streptomyces sp. NPDC019531 TaxID=3365062 RepID=UPI00384B89FB
MLGLARTVLDDPASPYTEVRYVRLRLAECLTDALRVAESRGLRLPAPGAGGDVAGVAEQHPETGYGQAAQNTRSGLWS